jgi:hypothetical protein
MKKSAIILFLLLFAADVFSQKSEWDILQTDDGELEMKMPAGCYSNFYDRDGITVYESNSRNRYQLAEMRLISCYRDRTLMSLEIYETEQTKPAAKVLQEKLQIKGAELSLGKNFYAVEKTDKNENYISNRRVIAGEKHVYIVTAATRGGEPNETMRTFLDSLRFNAAEKNRQAKANENAIFISSLVSVEPEVGSEKDEVQKTNALVAGEKKTESLTFKPVIIVSKPNPSYTEAARKNNINGKVALRLAFGAEGRINKIWVVRNLPDGLLREAVIAALRMKFLPEEENGKSRSTTKLVEYSFSIY